jgi:hypothetical protein
MYVGECSIFFTSCMHVGDSSIYLGAHLVVFSSLAFLINSNFTSHMHAIFRWVINIVFFI